MKKLVALIITVVPAALFAQGAPIAGTANVRLSTTAPAAIVGSQVVIDVNANLTGVTGSCAGSVPAVLGGYTLPVSFNNTQLQFVSAAACTSPQYAGAPTTTAPATANASGQVTVTASQINQSAPTGDVCVARLTFQVIGGNGTTLTPSTSGSLSSAVQTCSGSPTGPASIPFTVTGVTLAPGTAVPALSPLTIAALAMTLGAVALFSGAFK